MPVGARRAARGTSCELGVGGVQQIRLLELAGDVVVVRRILETRPDLVVAPLSPPRRMQSQSTRRVTKAGDRSHREFNGVLRFSIAFEEGEELVAKCR